MDKIFTLTVEFVDSVYHWQEIGEALKQLADSEAFRKAESLETLHYDVMSFHNNPEGRLVARCRFKLE